MQREREQIRHEQAHAAAFAPPMPVQVAAVLPDARVRFAYVRKLIARGFTYWKGTLAVLLIGAAATLFVAAHVKRVYRSECTVYAKPRIRTDDRDDSSTSPEQVARQAARLKDMLTTRARLESAIRRFNLYRETVGGKSMLDAVEEMKPHVGFRSLEGAQYVISFDGEDPDTVQKVTQYLSESLIDDYAAGDISDLRREADFLAQEERRSLDALEQSTRELTVFLAAHPEFAVEAKQAATPYGPSPTSGIPLLPKAVDSRSLSSNSPSSGSPVDAQLGPLYRERARLQDEARSAEAAARGIAPPSPAVRSLDDQIAQTQGEVEAAAKRVAETQADLASKSNLTEDHPDMRAARMALDSAARQLHESKVKLSALTQMKSNGAPPIDASRVPPEIAEKLRQLDAQIAARRTQAAKSRAALEGPDALRTGSGSSAVVELETEWQRLLRSVSEVRAGHDDLKLRAERAKLAVEAAHAEASQRMALVDPPFRPTHPSKAGRLNTGVGGLLAACLLAALYASGRVVMDDRLVDAQDVEGWKLLPVLGVVPRIDRAPGRVKGTSRHAPG